MVRNGVNPNTELTKCYMHRIYVDSTLLRLFAASGFIEGHLTTHYLGQSVIMQKTFEVSILHNKDMCTKYGQFNSASLWNNFKP